MVLICARLGERERHRKGILRLARVPKDLEEAKGLVGITRSSSEKEREVTWKCLLRQINSEPTASSLVLQGEDACVVVVHTPLDNKSIRLAPAQ